MTGHNYTALSNEDLSRAVAERYRFLLRLDVLAEHPSAYRTATGNEPVVPFKWDGVPPYATSMDAILSPGGPMAWLEEHPDLKYMGLYRDGGAFRWECEVFLGIREVMRHAEMPSRAFCLAFMAATDDGGAA